MSHFPMCIDLTGKPVLLVGSGAQCQDKYEKLLAFSPEILRIPHLEEEHLDLPPVLVVAGDLDEEEAARVSRLCRSRGIPVNVVDRPELCSFFFPALVCRGDLTVAVSTGGRSPAAAAHLRRRIKQSLPDRTGEIIQWLSELRGRVPGSVLRSAAQTAFQLGRPLSEDELPIE